jgi:hypothetical protein
MRKSDAASIRLDPLTAAYFTPIIDAWWRRSRILIVVDGNLSIREENDFGISRAIAHVRSFSSGYASFDVTLATRDGPARTNNAAGPEEFTYEGFRFDHKDAGTRGTYTLHAYDQLWLFGYLPGNGPENNPNDRRGLTDFIVDLPRFNPTSESELEVLSRWMDAGGSVFAAGDHQRLGASMCKSIPRVRTMRRWLAAQDAPTQDGPTRFDTQQPPNYDEIDPVPQPVRWVPMAELHTEPMALHAPHPLLCHPTLGPIDVLPDHMHEGRCFHPADFQWHVGHAHAKDKFGGYTIEHYPYSGVHRELPTAIAFGTTIGSESFLEGPQPHRETPLIVVYDGRRVSRGRVVVDSTWHHWFDMNLSEFDAPETQATREKIFRYYANVAIWLASPEWRSASAIGEIKLEQFRYFGREQFSEHSDSVQLGVVARKTFGPKLGPCWVWNLADEFYAEVGIQFERAGTGLWPHLNGSPRDYFCSMFFGELVKLVYADQPQTERQLTKEGQLKPTKISRENPLDLAREAGRRAAASIAEAWREGIEAGESLLKQLEAAGKRRNNSKALRTASPKAKRKR